MPHHSPQAIVFDLDGLMADSEPLAKWAWEQTLARFGHRLDDQVFRQALGLRVIDCARLFCERFSLPISPEEAMAVRNEMFLEAVPARLRARPGLYPLLDELDERGFPLAVATSGRRRYVNLALRVLELEGRFQVIASGDEVVWGKPAPDIYLLAAERLDAPPTRCLALEDAPNGLQAACAAGMVCLAVPNRWTSALDFPGAYRVFPSLREVKEGLDDILSEAHFASEEPLTWYVAAGGVVVHDGRVLVLHRPARYVRGSEAAPSRGEVRLPKGHVAPGEETQAAALREVREESGYGDLAAEADLGAQLVEFEHGGRHVVRIERYFLVKLGNGPESAPSDGEEQFEPVWLSWEEALAKLTFEPEREWVRRARAMGR